MNVIGLDIGYGFTKATDGEVTTFFPSVIGDAVKADFDTEVVEASKGLVITLNGQDWVYGAHAQKHSRNPLVLFARERTKQRDLMRILFYAAMAELGMQGPVALTTGLPVDWFVDKEELERMLLGPHALMVDGQPRHIFVSQVATVPQPFGSFFDLIMDETGRITNGELARSKVGILDIGTYTCDLALCDGLEYVAKSSGSKTLALSNVWRQVRDAIKDLYRLDYELHKIDDIMSHGRTIIVQGREQQVSDLVWPAIDALAQQVIAFTRDRWGQARDFKRIFLTGGGAHFIEDEVKKIYPHCQVIHDPALGNLRGFYKYAVRRFG